MTAVRIPAALFLLTAVVYGLTVNADPSPDAFTADFAAWHIARTGDPVPDIADFPLLDDNIIRETWIVETTDGREAVGRAPGVIAAVVPAYWLLGSDVISPIPGGLTAAVLTALTVTLLFSLLRRHLTERDALLTAAIFGFATPVWSVAADAIWPHTLTCLGIVVMAWAADRKQWRLAGLGGGVALWGRLHAALICAILGVGLAVVRRERGIAVRVGVVATACLLLTSVWTRWMYGSWDPTSGYRAGDFTDNVLTNLWRIDNLLGFFISPDRGVLVWTPLLIVLAPALRRGWADLPDWARMLVWSGVGYFVSQALLNRFSGGDQFYGYRTSLELVTCLVPALALTAHRMGPVARRWFAPVAVLQWVLILPGAVLQGPYVKAGQVWFKNAYVSGWFHRPEVFALLLALGVVVGVAIHRVAGARRAPATATVD